jgi:uncharacterized protein YigE (DUF2233 family)
MRNRIAKYIYFSMMLILMGVMLLPGEISHSQIGVWEKVDEGLLVGTFPAVKSAGNADADDSKISVVKIDPHYYKFKLLCASEKGHGPMTAKDWCKTYNLTAAINAGMYQADNLTSVGYMKNFSHINNPRVGKDNTVFAFNPADSALPGAQIIDRKCQNYSALKTKYQSQFQGIRMIAEPRKNVWDERPDEWSVACLGTDSQGNILFIFSETPFSVHQFIDILLDLPIGISKAMYLDGGAVAQLYLSKGKVEIDKVGLYESVLTAGISRSVTTPIPNVIGIVKR